MNQAAFSLTGFEELKLPKLMENETIYSWCGRFHHLTRFHDPKQTSQALFNCKNAALILDIPTNLNIFESNTQQRIGTANEILYKSTSYGFHSKFLTKELEQNTAQLLLRTNRSIAHVKLNLNTLDFKFRSILKFCPICIENQIRDTSFSWWKIQHQLPTAFVCYEHGNPLQIVEVQHSRSYTKDFKSPLLNQYSFSINNYFKNTVNWHHLIQVSAWGQRIWEDSTLKIPTEILRWCCLYRLKTIGLIGTNGNVDIDTFKGKFVNFYDEALYALGSECLRDLKEANSNFFTFLMKRQMKPHQPLKFVFLIKFLFDNFDEFLAVQSVVEKDLLEGGVAFCEAYALGRLSSIKSVTLGAGQTLQSLASRLDLPELTVAKHTIKQGIPSEILPRIIGTDKELLIKESLLKGLEYKDVAIAAGVRASYIKRYISKRTSLKQEWHKAHHQKQLLRQRENFLKVLTENSNITLSALRRTPNSGFNWLFIKDKEWLKNTLPAIWQNDLN